MKIDRIRLHLASVPLVAPFETSFGRHANHGCIIVEVRSGGLTGWGECPVDENPGYSYETLSTAWHILKDYLVPSLLGSEPDGPESLKELFSNIRGHPIARSGIEMALWDLKGKREGKSLQQLLGGRRELVEVGVSVGLQQDPVELVRTVESYVQAGYGRVKLKIKPGRDVGDVLAVRQALPDLKLQVDANSAYSLGTAQDLQPLDEMDLLLIEQPLAEDDLWDHQKLQRMFKTPICLDESIVHPQSARHAVEMQACRIINIKQARVGGVSNALEIHDYCRTQGIPVWCGGMLETGIGRAANLALASLPNFTLPGDISATDRYFKEDITDQHFTLNAGSTINVPLGPGLGVTVNQKSLGKFTLSRLEIPANS